MAVKWVFVTVLVLVSVTAWVLMMVCTKVEVTVTLEHGIKVVNKFFYSKFSFANYLQ